MNRIDCNRTAGIGRQTGTTLILALVLLLLATLLTLFAMNVGIFAQRSSAADLRARIIHQTLEAALSQGVEYIKNNRTSLIATMLSTPCDASADPPTFPCGTVPKCASGAVSGSGCTDPNLARRGNSYYYFNSAGPGYDVNNNGSVDALDKASLPIGASRMTSASNGFTVDYGVGAVMCMIKKPTSASDPTECTTNSNNAQGTYIFTVTAVGAVEGESAGSTLSMTFGTSPVAPGAGSAPTITASGTVSLNGNGTFVTNPNAAGTGVPVTVWSPQCVNTQGSGTVNTCYLEDWLRSSAGTYTFAANSDGTTSNVPVCSGNGNNTCACSPTSGLSSGPGSLTEGIDILTNDNRGSCTGAAPNVAGTGADCTKVNCRANYNVDESEFPCDLFQYIFGIPSWEDDAIQSPGVADTTGLCKQGTGPYDCFCEKHKSTTYTVADGSSQTMGPDEAYLYSKAAYIYSTAHPAWVTSAQKATSCSDLITKGSATGGLLWDQTGGCLKSASQIGYPDKPVILVADGSADLQGATVFGIVFIRDTTAAGSSTSYGGTANFVGHSTGTIYGAMVVQGTASKINGTSAIVYNGQILTALAGLNTLNPAGPLPGSWTDRYAY